MSIDTQFFLRCILTLEQAYTLLQKAEPESIEYEMYRSASVKEFEIILEQSGKLLKKALKPYFHSPKAVERLVFKDIFRQATQYGLVDVDACERWMNYRDNRNNTAHDYGKHFAEKTMGLMPGFINDAKQLEATLRDTKQDD